MSAQLTQVLEAIDAANAKDPNLEDGQPAALLYGRRMSEEQARLSPAASEPLQIAARGQHVERWKLAREAFPEGRAGYLAWRQAEARHHAELVTGLMRDAGYGAEEQQAAARMLRKEGIKRDPEVQALEDIACFTFLKWYFAPFAAKHPEDKVQRIVAKTARKMSPGARARVLEEFQLAEPLAAAFRM
ncbi:DUF4202 domain-containing protein [Cribrihabitans neustonicus]|uniref:DUF4202 domain-containing protein n=1 Tax=Cribrihabitans neustonicus TaxID=1429085 RepID=UPI003B599E43